MAQSQYPIDYTSDVDLQLPLVPSIDTAINQKMIYDALREIARSSYGRVLKPDYSIAASSFLREQAIGRVYLQATESMTKGDFVNIFISGGVAKIQKADAAGSKAAHGWVSSDISFVTNDYVEVTPWMGLNLQKTGLTAGASYYLGAAGAISTSPGTFSQFLGIALSTTILLVSICCPGTSTITGGGGAAPFTDTANFIKSWTYKPRYETGLMPTPELPFAINGTATVITAPVPGGSYYQKFPRTQTTTTAVSQKCGFWAGSSVGVYGNGGGYYFDTLFGIPSVISDSCYLVVLGLATTPAPISATWVNPLTNVSPADRFQGSYVGIGTDNSGTTFSFASKPAAATAPTTISTGHAISLGGEAYRVIISTVDGTSVDVSFYVIVGGVQTLIATHTFSGAMLPGGNDVLGPLIGATTGPTTGQADIWIGNTLLGIPGLPS